MATVNETRDAGRRAIAEAAAWLARLRSDSRPPEAEAAFRLWLDESPEHRAAFEAVSAAWDASGAASPPRRQPLRRVALAAAILLAVAVPGIVWVLAPAPVATAVGERRTLALADGSLVTLNTGTELVAHFDDDERRVRLRRGEASFDVAKDVNRPFVVEAGSTRIEALGTSFDVRWLAGAIAVTLGEGRVRIVDDTGQRPVVAVLAPGERFVRDARRADPVLRDVDLTAARAWREGKLVFDDTALAAAVAEVNRYSERPIQLADADVHDLRVSGSFDAARGLAFARAVADLHGLTIEAGEAAIVVGRPDASISRADGGGVIGPSTRH